MINLLERILIWAQARLPDAQGDWIEDLRLEAQHVPRGFRRVQFLWGGVQAAFGQILWESVGPRKLGQALFALSGTAVCLFGFISSFRIEDPIVKLAFYILLMIYGIAAMLAVINLKLLKRFTLSGSLFMGAVWIFLGIQTFLPVDFPIIYVRALSIEGSFVLMSLFIGASYLAWVERPEHA